MAGNSSPTLSRGTKHNVDYPVALHHQVLNALPPLCEAQPLKGCTRPTSTFCKQPAAQQGPQHHMTILNFSADATKLASSQALPSTGRTFDLSWRAPTLP